MVCERCNHGRQTPTGAVSEAHIQTPETTEVRSWTSLPLIDVTDVPEDLDLICGSNKEYRSWRIPASYFLPGGTFNKTQYEVAKGTSAITLPTRQVVPAYIPNADSSWTAAVASDMTTLAQALVVKDENDVFTLMNGSFFTFARPHMYEVGKTYYLSQENDGEVVSVRPTAGLIQPLFTVVDQLTIAINISLL